jgi:hypothetical protein
MAHSPGTLRLAQDEAERESRQNSAGGIGENCHVPLRLTTGARTPATDDGRGGRRTEAASGAVGAASRARITRGSVRIGTRHLDLYCHARGENGIMRFYGAMRPVPDEYL